MKPSVHDIRLGAIYRFGAARKMGRDALVALLNERAGFSDAKAKQLAGHWLTTLPYRAALSKAEGKSS